MELRIRLQNLMEVKDLSVTGFAHRVGIDGSNFAKMMKGSLTITDKTLRKITMVFPDVNYEWLANGVGEMLCEENRQHPPTGGVSSDAPSADSHAHHDTLVSILGRLVDIQEQNSHCHKSLLEEIRAVRSSLQTIASSMEGCGDGSCLSEKVKAECGIVESLVRELTSAFRDFMEKRPCLLNVAK